MSNGLGRGLGSLIPQKVNKAGSAGGESIIDISSDSDKDRVLRIPPSRIKINPMQPRKEFNEVQLNELIESIKIYGIIQPLIVTDLGSGYYELIAGERRLRASKAIGLDTVPVIVREAKEQEKLELALIENIQREQLNPIETGLAYRKLIDEFGLTQEDVAKRVGKSRPVVANTLRFLNLPDEIRDALVRGKINEGHAKIILGLDSEEKQMILFRKIVHRSMTVSDTIKETQRMGGTKAARIKAVYADKEKEDALQHFFGTKAEIRRKGTGGTIVINFFSDEELEGILNKLR
jgi:ParB family transcriptional regulator, chromosome partitioning protein